MSYEIHEISQLDRARLVRQTTSSVILVTNDFTIQRRSSFRTSLFLVDHSFGDFLAHSNDRAKHFSLLVALL